MSIELKIKNKHLSEEARIIRFEEKKELRKARHKIEKLKEAGQNDLGAYWYIEQQTYRSLNRHRRWDVRNENRATYLARAYITGVPYEKVEQKRIDDGIFRAYIFPRILAMVVKYDKTLTQQDKAWKNNRTVASYVLKDKIASWCNL